MATGAHSFDQGSNQPTGHIMPMRAEQGFYLLGSVIRVEETGMRGGVESSVDVRSTSVGGSAIGGMFPRFG
uniref:Uncharacterized protein n=1 Tax=Ralstonia solanacearum TaxID=305 RepID=A0A0S4TYR6_RALSL|nr:protein of unknown function [Ralstonia solanacearum]